MVEAAEEVNVIVNASHSKHGIIAERRLEMIERGSDDPDDPLRILRFYSMLAVFRKVSATANPKGEILYQEYPDECRVDDELSLYLRPYSPRNLRSELAMSKPVLYVFEGCVWATAPQLAVYELGYEDQVVEKRVNLVAGANFQPEFLQLNPNGTLPTLTTSSRIYTSPKEVVCYLIEHAPKPGGRASGTSLINKLHSSTIDPNFSMLSSRSEAELKEKANGLGGRYVRGRMYKGQATLQRLARTSPQYKAFYDAKLVQNGFLLSLLDGVASPSAVRYFIARSKEHWCNVSRFILIGLPPYLPESGFIGGDRPGEDDFHLAVWLVRTVAVLGGSPDVQGIKSLERVLGGSGSVPRKVHNYWKLWSGRDSWKTLYCDALH